MKIVGWVFSILVMIFFPVVMVITARAVLIEKQNYLEMVEEKTKQNSNVKVETITNQAQLFIGNDEILYSEKPTLVVVRNRGRDSRKEVVIKKVDKESYVPLKNAVFDVITEKGKPVKTNIKTGENGWVSEQLAPGNYFLIEIQAPEEYREMSTRVLFTVR